MRLLEINPEKRITACQALEHPFLLENSKMSLKNEEIYNIDAEEGHALKLYDTTNHEYLLINHNISIFLFFLFCYLYIEVFQEDYNILF